MEAQWLGCWIVQVWYPLPYNTLQAIPKQYHSWFDGHARRNSLVMSRLSFKQIERFAVLDTIIGELLSLALACLADLGRYSHFYKGPYDRAESDRFVFMSALRSGGVSASSQVMPAYQLLWR